MLRGISHESDVGSGDINAHVTRIPVADNDADHRVIVPDTELLFSAKFLKSGSDLVLVGENGHKIVLSGYFDHARHADLVAPGGAILTADVVAKLTISQTPGQYAQAGAPAGAVVIGKVERIGGSATVQHANGTVEELKIGDNVYQGDVVETGSGSQLGMSFIDGTAFNMGAAARMVLSELLYDANSNSNSGVFSLVKGTISFVAGKVAKTGDMRVDTPVATMGIRGTSVNTNITTDVGGNTVSVTYSLMRDPDGHVGSFNILDRVSGAIIGTITTTDTTFVVTPTANLGVLATQLNKSPEQIAQELATAQALFPIFLANPANFNSQNVNPQNGSHGSSSPPPGGSQQNFNNTGPTKTGPGGVTIIDDGDDPSGTGNVHVVIHVNTPPSVFADTPSHLVEAVSLGAAGTDTTSSHITKLDLDGTVSYDVAALANAGWIDVGNGIYSKLGTYGAASLNTGVASVASLVAAGWHDLGNGYLEKAVSFGAAGNETIRISSGADSVTYALDNAKADSLRQIDHPTETFAIPVVDNSLATATTNVVFTIDGENDPPAVVLGSTNTTGGVTEDANPNVLTSTGTITFRDPELTDAHTATAVFTSSTSDLPGFVNNTTHIGTFTVDANATENTADTNNIGTFGWRFDLDDSNPVLQSLAAGETITQVYTVTIRDDHGGSVAQQITITITGTNDGPTTNSAPVIVASETVATGDFTERTSPTPSTGLSLTDGANGTITFLDVDLTDTHTVNSSFVSALWTKNGITQPVSITDPGSIALTLHENPADTNNKGTIDWAYSVTDSRLDFLAAGETLVVTYNVSVADSSSSTVQPVTVTIHGTNDVPVITSSTQAGSVTEDADGSANENNENHTVTGTVTFTDVDLSDVETSSITNTVVTPSLANGYALTQAQQNALVNAFSIQSATHSSANGTGGIGWTYNIADSALDFLGANDTATLTYTVQVADGHNGTATQDVTITVHGTNDAPVITSSTQAGSVTEDADGSVNENNENHTVTGTVTFTDVDLSDVETSSIANTVVNASLANGYVLTTAQHDALVNAFSIQSATHSSTDGTGRIDWTYTIADGALDFLGANDTVTLTYRVQVADGHNGRATQDVTITVHGTNDAPVITSSAQAGSVTELADGSANENQFSHSTSGLITFTDVDLSDVETSSIANTVVNASLANGYALTQTQHDALVNAFSIHAATHSSTDGTGRIDWTYDIADSALDFLGANDTVTLTYTVQVADGHNGRATQDVTITVHGTNDVPVITSSTQAGSVTEDADGSANENNENHTVTGTVTFTDVDLSDVETSSIANTDVNVSLANGYALTQTQHDALVNAFSIQSATHSSANGTGGIGWTYDIADGALDFLGANDTVTLTYTVQVADGHNGTATQDVTITVHGTNDIPVITSSAQAGSVTEDADGSANENNENHTVTGTVTFTDVDLSDVETSSIANTDVNVSLANGYALTQTQHDALVNAFSIQSATHSSANGTGGIGWTYNIADSALDFLGANDTVTLTYTVQVADGHNGTATQDVTITVHGTNDAPIVSTTPDIQRVSVPNPVSAGADSAAQDAIAPVLSEDGRFVVFDSAEAAPTGSSDNPLGDIYLYDRLTGETTTLTDSAHIPTRPTGELYSGFAISADGNLVAFKGEYPVDNSGGGPDHLSEIYVYNRTTNTTHVLTDPVSHTAYSPNDQVRISAGGLIVFTTNGYDPNTPVPPSVKVVNQAGTVLASVAPSDLGITDQSIGFGAADISGNGRYVTFWALSNDLNGNPTGLQTLYTYDRTSHAYQTLATSSATHDGWWASMSSDGQFVVYQSDGGTVGGQSNIFIWNRSSGQTQSITAGADSSSGRPSISSDGRYITFESSADNLVTGDTNGHKDTFIYDTQNNAFQILSLAGDGVTQGNADSDLASDVSPGGRFAAFGGLATNLASPNDPASQAGYSGVFIVDRSGGTVGVVAEDTTKPDVVGGTPNNTLSTHGAFKFSDADLSDAHTATVGNNVAIDTSRAPAGFVVPTSGLGTFAATVVENTADANSNGKIAWIYTVDNSLVQSLGAGQSVSQTYTVQIDDGHNGTITQTVRIIITGTNDTPVVSGAVTDTTVVEDGSVSTLNALANASDVDLGTVLAVVNVPTTLPAGVTYDSVHHTFSLDPSNATFQPLAAGEQRVVTVNYGVSDGSVTTPASVSWTVTGVNDAPVFTGTATGTAFVEQGSAVSVAANVTASDVDSANYNGGSLTATVTAGGHQGDKLSVSNGPIISVDTGGTVSFDSDGAGGNAPVAIGHLTDNINSLTVSLNSNATDAAVIALTQAIQFSSNSDDPTADTRTVTFTLKDGGGHAGTGTDTTYFNANVNVTPVNDAPAFSGSYAGTDFVENGAAVTVAANVSVSDVDSTNYDHGKLTVALTSPALTGDTLAIAPNDHISLANVASGTAVMFDSDGAGGAAAVAIGEVHTSGANITVNFNSSATDAAVKALVEAIQFSSSSENPTDAVRTVTFTLQDGGGTDNSGHDTTSFQVDVGVTPVNDAPVNTVPGAQSVDEDTGLSMTGLSVGDVDASSADITVNLAVGHGTINVLDNVFVNTGGIISGNGTASVTLTGSQSAIDATLAAANGVIYRGAQNYSGQDTLTVTTDDGGNSGDGAALQDIDTVAITVNPVADAPVLMGPLAASLTDNFSGASLDPQKWTVAAPTLIGDVDDWSVTQANGVVQIHDRGYLQTVAGFTPTAATPLHISFTWSPSDAYLLVTDRTQGGDTPTGISFVGNWTIGDPGALVIFDRATGFSANTRVDASLTPGATYDVDITDDGSHQTFTVADHSTHAVVAALTSDFGGTPAGNLVSFSNREGADGQHTDTIDNVSISSAYQGVEDNAVTLSGLAAALVDPSETLSLTLTGFPAGTTFSTGTLQDSTHLFLTAAQIASLSSNPLSMTPPADFNGPITLTVQATSTESDASNATTTRTLEVVITPVNDAPIMSGDPAGQAFVEHGNAVNVATNVSVSDIDNANFSGGSLTATVGTGWHTGDHLSLATNDYFTVDTGGSVMFDSDGAGTNFDAVSIGHLTNNGTSLTVDLNGNASADAVAALISDIQFSSTSHNPTADDRTVTFTLVDGSGTANGGHDTASFAASVSVTPVNDAPVIASLGYVPSQNLILNGSFESGSGAAQHFIGTAAGNVDDWTFPGGAGSVDIIDSAGDPNYAWQAAEGFRSLDMSGEHAGSITQSFATVVGAQYTVHFSLAASPGEAVNKLLVSVGSGTEQLYTFDSSSHTASDMGWTTQSYTFTATGTTTTLWFESIEDATTGQVYAGAALDNVSVVSNLSINGLISFTDPDTADTHTASFVAENNGAGYVGAFSLDAAVTESNGSGSIGWHFDRPLTEPAQVITQAYDVTISDGHTGGTVTQTISVALGTANADSLDGNSAQVLIGGAGGDTFSFVGTQFGAVTVADFAASSATSAHDVIQLDSGDFTTLIDQAHEANGSTVIDVGTSTITLANILKQSLTASDFHFGSTT